ncbi:MAG: OsmC family protein [Gammaproteobacteria bacterium]
MKLTLDWLGGVAFCAGNGDGKTLVFDGAPEIGGEDRGMRPMEVLLASAAACSAIDAALILRKSKSAPETMQVQITGERADTLPRVFVKIHLHYILRGGDVRDAAAARAVQLSVEKYCSALAMLNNSATITHSWARE